MKKYLQDRNEQLFNRLFESQDIKPNLGEVHVVTGEPAEEGIDLTDLENLLRGEVEEKIRQGASPDQMAKLVTDLDAIIAYKLAGKGYMSPLISPPEGVNELGIPKMASWQHIGEVLTPADMGKLEKTLDRPEIQSALGKSENSWKASSQAIGSLMVQLKNKGAEQDDLTKSLKYLLRQISGEEDSTEDSESNESQGVILDPKEK
tara:strand:+ start:1843 stop:2457 length:615 start_codon:yes stop_codon:yes gene_type:complete